MLDYRVPAPAEIDAAREQAIAGSEAIVTRLLSTADAERTFENTLLPLDEVRDLLDQASGRYGFMSYVAADAPVRDAADGLREALDKYGIDLGFREDLYAAVSAFARTPEAAALTGERARLLERTLRDYRRNGFELPPEDRARVRELRNRLVELGIAFQRNIDTYEDAILVTREQLAGLPDSYISRLRT